jgi:hypothetical protein
MFIDIGLVYCCRLNLISSGAVYLCSMAPVDELKQDWLTFETAMAHRLGKTPDLDDVLILVGIKEAGLPPKQFTEAEKINLIQMAICTILVPADYYELFWVEDSGWPHYKQLERVPEMAIPERDNFLKPFVLLYHQRNKLI